jgi:hypothetical protein
MMAARRGRSPLDALASALALAAMLLLAACAGPAPAPTASAAAATAATPAALASPVTGRLVGIDSGGLTRVKGFTMRLDDGSEVAFVIGSLENGAVFPPGHLAEHMASSSAVTVFFRDEGGAHVVYRLEDGE